MQHFQRRPCAKAAGRVALQAIRPRVMLMPADIDGHNEEIKVTTHDQALEMAMSQRNLDELGVEEEISWRRSTDEASTEVQKASQRPANTSLLPQLPRLVG